MASDTVPAAVPGPADPPADHTTQPSGQPQPGGLAGLLAPLQPARSAAFSLPDIPTIDDALDPAAGTATSADFQNTDTPQNTTGKDTKNARQERGIVRAWLLAGAERWRKGGDARLKRLDIEKARAQAFKEARQIRETRTVNRAEKTGGGALNSSTGSSTKAGKQNNSKTSSGSTGAKNSTGGSGGGASRSGSRGGSGGGSSSGGAGRGGAHRPSGSTKTPSGGSAGTGGRGHGGSTSGPNPVGGKPASKHDKPAKPKPGAGRTTGGGTTPSHGSGSSGSSGSGKTVPSGAPGKPNKDAPKPHHDPKIKDSTSKTPNAPGSRTAAGTAPGAASTGSKVDLDKKPKNKTGKDGKPAPGAHGPASDASAPPTGGPRVNTQSSRETGYRDGTRAAKIAAHVEAWRDGARDGWTDTRKAAAHDKARLDKAHADQTARDKDQPMTQPASSADYQPHTPPKPDHAPATGPQPIQVTGIDATHIHLGDGADRSTLSRGEVRTLKQFERRMRPKADVMTRIGDATKALKTEAEERAKKITQLAEQAKTIKGGDQLVAKLLKFQEQAQVQVQGAEELHKRALRAAEACTTVVTNADTRYGQIYKAVIDSDLTTPAELRFYTDKAS
ncbi:hypothetical protein [Streptomyces sp. NPDC003395]